MGYETIYDDCSTVRDFKEATTDTEALKAKAKIVAL